MANTPRHRDTVVTRLRAFVSSHLSLYVELAWTLKNLARCADRSVRRTRLTGKDCILVGHIGPSLARGLDGHAVERYFGMLPETLRRLGQTPFLCGLVNGRAATAIERVRAVPDAATYLHIISLADVMRAFLWVFAGAQLRHPDDVPAIIRQRMSRHVRRSLRDIFQARLLESALAHLIDANPAVHMIEAFENAPWGRAAAFAFHQRLGTSLECCDRLSAYLCTPIIPGRYSSQIPAEEVPWCPAPKRFITTGPMASAIFAEVARYPTWRIVDGCELHASSPAPRLDRTGVQVVLVLLGSPLFSLPMVRYVADAAPSLPTIEFRLRGHPDLPAEWYVNSLGLDLGKLSNITIDRSSALNEGLLKSDAVIYKASTAVMYAARMGLPIIYFDGGERPTLDPLFRCPWNRVTVSSGCPTDLATAIEYFRTMTPKMRQKQSAEMIAHVQDYLREPRDEYMRAFLTSVDQGVRSTST